MAFTLYQSNRQEDLFTLFAALFQQSHATPVLVPEKVVIPSQGMAKWLNIALAEQLGIAANIAFELPGTFIWSLIRLLIPATLEQSPYRPEVLVWRIYVLLQSHALQAPPIQHYLQHANSLQVYQLAHNLASLIDQYVVYRPDWLTQWENHRLIGLGEDEAWQATLWQLLQQEAELPPTTLLTQALRLLNRPNALLPARIFCFGVSHLPPIYLNFLQQVGTQCDVHYFVLNPCKENWIDDRDYHEQLRLAGREDPEQLYLELGHPLLSSLAKQQRDFFARLNAVPSIDVFSEEGEIQRDSLLHRLQADILCRTLPTTAMNLTVDDSLCVHSCHSPMREIEILHDTLLHCLQADISLNPTDILVLAPDISVYAPYIDAVFSAPDVAVPLPFSIGDKNPLQSSVLFSLVIDLLSLPNQRFEVNWIFDLIDHPALLRRFGLQTIHMPLLREWVQSVNIFWGRDAQHKAQYGLPAEETHTWRGGLERLLLACALPQEMAVNTLPIFAERLPGRVIAITQRGVLAGFVTLIETLIYYAERLHTERTMHHWVIEIASLIEACFTPNDEEEKELLLIQDLLAQLITHVEEAQTEALISVEMLAWILAQRLNQANNNPGFLGRGITFCNMVPLRALPARIICVLGLQHDAFPRQVEQIDMDLMQQYPRSGDRARRQDDRYLFLETLLSARDRLYLSYIGQDIRTNQSLPASVLIEELLDVIDSAYPLSKPARECLVNTHSLQPFNAQYFCQDGALHSFQTTWLHVAQAHHEEKQAANHLFSQPLAAPQTASPLQADTLLRFYRHPIRFLLQTSLSITLPWQQTEAPIEASILLNKKARVAIRERILQYQQHAQQMLRLEGHLPIGVFGDYPYQEEQKCMADWLQACDIQCDTTPLALMPIQLEQWEIITLLPTVDAQRGIILSSLYDTPQAYDRIKGWLQHLLLCIAAPDGVCLHTCISSLLQQYHHATCTVAEAQSLLLPWLRYFEQGLCTPLPFFVRTSLRYAEQIQRGKSWADATKAAQQIFTPGFEGKGEGTDPYLIAAYQGLPILSEEFKLIAQTLLLPMLQHEEVRDVGV